jgi:hypothetical protein
MVHNPGPTSYDASELRPPRHAVGHLGRVALGAQYEYLKREAFNGLGGAPSTDDSVVYTSVRYYPF